MSLCDVQLTLDSSRLQVVNKYDSIYGMFELSRLTTERRLLQASTKREHYRQSER